MLSCGLEKRVELKSQLRVTASQESKYASQQSTDQEKQQIGVIVAVGNGGMIDGKEVVMQVEVGQKVLYAKYSGSDFKYEGKEYVIIRQSDILAIVE